MASRIIGWLRRRSPELYFLTYNASIVFILPWLTILWKSQGLSGAQIGVLSAVRPFVCSISGQLLVALADARRWHFWISLITYIITMAARSSMALATGFIAQLCLVLVSEACQSPFSIMSDAAIAASTDEAGYGRKRVLASLGWGCLAPLSGFIVARWGVPYSIAVYVGIVAVALLPLLLLPLKEMGRKRTFSAPEAASDALARCSAAPLLSNMAGSGSGDLDSRQHDGHAAELAIELWGAPAKAAPVAVVAPGDELAERISSKLALGSDTLQLPGLKLPPLLTTADEDEARTARAAQVADASAPADTADTADVACSPTSPAPDSGDDNWSISAVGSPLAARRSSLPPISCPHGSVPASAQPTPVSRSSALAISRPPGLPLSATPLGSSFGGAGAFSTSALGRTTSLATTAYFSVRSAPSVGSMPGSAGLALSPRGAAETGASVPRAALFRQGSETGLLVTPRTAFTTAAAAGSQHNQGGLYTQASNVSQTLNGFDQSFLEGSISDGTFLTPRDASATFRSPRGMPPLSPRDGSLHAAQGESAEATAPPLLSSLSALPAVRTVHPPSFVGGANAVQPGSSGINRILSDGSERQLRRRSSSRSLQAPGRQDTIKSALLAALLLPSATGKAAAADAGAARQPLLADGEDEEDPAPVVLSIDREVQASSMHSSPSVAAVVPTGDMEAPAEKTGGDASVWAGIKQLLANPHHAAFFATTFLMGMGYGVLGYSALYMKESGGTGMLIGVCQMVGTLAGEMPLFATTGWWLPRLGHTLAFNIGMAGWVLRLALYTLIPVLPSVWCIVPVECLQGLTFAAAYGVGSLHVKKIAPVHLRSTTQSLFFSLYYGVGPGISGLAGGFLYDALGMRFVFIIGACTLAVGWAAVQLALHWATRAERAQRAEVAQLAVGL